MEYLHGYTQKEQERLIDQSLVLADYIYPSLSLDDYQHLLEIGSGVGAQTAIMLLRHTALEITCVEREPLQIQKAESHLGRFEDFAGRYTLVCGDAGGDLPEVSREHDAALFIWVLEHVARPAELLRQAARYVKSGGRILAVEVYNSSFALHPPCPAVAEFWERGKAHQAAINGNGDVGFRLGHLLAEAGCTEIQVLPRSLHLGGEAPKERRRVLRYWRDLMESWVEGMAATGHLPEGLWEKADAEMRALLENEEAVFHYTFIIAAGTCP